jgi:hypothetical protein
MLRALHTTQLLLLYRKLKELYLLDELKNTDARQHRHMLRYYYLYQIFHLLVKEKSPIPSNFV